MRPIRPVSQSLKCPTNRQLPCWRAAPFQTRGRHSTLPTNRGNVAQRPELGQDPRTIPLSEQYIQNNQINYVQVPFSPNQEEYQHNEEETLRQLHDIPYIKVRYLRPAIWALTVSAGLYITLAYLEANESSKPLPRTQIRRFQPRITSTPNQVLSNFWNDLDPIARLSIGIIATNGAVHLGSIVAPSLWYQLWHTPARNVNYTLLTSTFVHSGPMHLLLNMWVCWNFLLPTGHSRLFEGNPYHSLSFFLSTGVLSGYAQHLSTIFSNPLKSIQAGQVPQAFIRSGGASGALFGVFGAFCMEYPDASVGIIFIPISVAASTFLPCIMAFDLFGIVRGFRGLNLGHAVSMNKQLAALY